MEKNLNVFKFDSDNHVLSETRESSRCDICGEEFEQPLFALVSSGYLVEEYYACPRCLSKVGDVERRKSAEDEEDDQSQETKVEIEMEKMEETVVCPHYLGYLKKRQKNSSIPEGCFTCRKMIECLSH